MKNLKKNSLRLLLSSVMVLLFSVFSFGQLQVEGGKKTKSIKIAKAFGRYTITGPGIPNVPASSREVFGCEICESCESCKTCMQIIPHVYDLEYEMFGIGEKKGKGDRDVHTSLNRIVEAESTSILFIEENVLKLKITYTIQEKEGDRTRIESSKVITVYEPERRQELLAFTLHGDNELLESYKSIVNDEIVGEQHGFVPQDIEEEEFPFWVNLSYKVDSDSDNDEEKIGMKGVLVFNVVLEVIPN